MLIQTVGSPLTFTPTTGTVTFTSKTGETWTEQLIGWSVTVTYANQDEGEIETHIEPVVLDGLSPSTETQYRQARDGDAQIRFLKIKTN